MDLPLGAMDSTRPFRKLTPENWDDHDPTGDCIVRVSAGEAFPISETEWADAFLALSCQNGCRRMSGTCSKWRGASCVTPAASIRSIRWVASNSFASSKQLCITGAKSGSPEGCQPSVAAIGVAFRAGHLGQGRGRALGCLSPAAQSWQPPAAPKHLLA